MNLEQLALYLTSLGSTVQLSPSDTHLPPEFQEYLEIFQGQQIDIEVGSTGIELTPTKLTIVGSVQSTWSIPGLGTTSIQLTSADIRIHNDGTKAEFHSLLNGTLTLAPSLEVPITIHSDRSKMVPWRMLLAESLKNASVTDLLTLGGRTPRQGIPTPVDIGSASSVGTHQFFIDFDATGTNPCCYEFELEAPQATWTVIPNLIEFTGISFRALQTNTSSSLLIESTLEVGSTPSYPAQVGIALGRGDVITLFLGFKKGQKPSIDALISWLWGSAKATNFSSALKSINFDENDFNLSLRRISVDLDAKQGALLELQVLSSLKIAGMTFDLALTFPDTTLVGSLHGSETLNVGKWLVDCGLGTASFLPTSLVITSAYVSATPHVGMYTIGMSVGGTWTVGPVTIENFSISLGYYNNALMGSLGGTFAVKGCEFYANYQFGPGNRVLTGGWQASGTNGLSLYDLASSFFDVKAGWINDLSLTRASFTCDLPDPSQKGASPTFSFDVEGQLKIGSTLLELNLSFEKDTSGSGAGITLQGTALINGYEFTLTSYRPSSAGPVGFSLEFTNTTNQSVDITGLVTTLCPKLQGDLPDLSLDIQQIDLVLYKSDPSSGSYEFIVDVDLSGSLNLSEIPIVGKALGPDEALTFSNTKILVSSSAIASTEVPNFSHLISNLPSNGLGKGGMISGSLAVGDSVAEPFAFSVGGGSSSSTQESRKFTALAESSTTTTPSVHWIQLQKTIGPLSFSQIGFQYQSGDVVVYLDATITLGPFAVTLDGLSVALPLSALATGQGLDPVFDLCGLGLSYTKPPLTVAGLFVNQNPPGAGQVEFEGGVSIGTEAFQLNAFGFYGNQTGAPSMFIFGDVVKDFGGPPAFFVTAVALGFGYNSQVRLPTVTEVATFPFIQVLPDANPPQANALPTKTPLGVLTTLMQSPDPWVTQVQGDLWFAAGLTFTSFEMVNSQALIVLETGTDLTISLLGTSQAQFPQDATAGGPRYAYIELDLKALFKPEDGLFSVEAVLSPASFLLDPACVLTGGFAFFLWYGDNPHAGDFVLTLGGYNPYYTPPSYYPTVPRLGFHWSLDSSISITGDAYLAFTPSILMVGGALKAVYQSGNLKAWFDAEADVIVQWKPFWFIAHMGINIGASYRIDLLFTSFTVSIDLGCDLTLWGPPTGGSVHVDWYIISFSVPFGSSLSSINNNLSWSDVEAMLPNTGTSDNRNVLSVTALDGIMPPPACPGDPTKASTWKVRGGQFAFTTATSIPITKATAGQTSHGSLTATEQPTAPPSFSGSTFNIAPLKLTEVSSTYNLHVQNSKKADVTQSFTVTPVYRSLPASLWGSPSSSTPSATNHLVEDQLIGLKLEANPPQLGSTAGPVVISTSLAADNLLLPQAVLPLSASAQPAGPIPTFSASALTTIADPTQGISSSAAQSARGDLLSAIQTLGYLAGIRDDSMTQFSGAVTAIFDDQPLLVS